jgi:hypothetical protein
MDAPRTRIANPIYDGAFKYLLDDNRTARLFLSTIIGEEITELTFRPTEYRSNLQERHVTVFRMDFSARIALPDGREKLVILEIQKAKFATDIMRFRKYLGSQYASKDNVFGVSGAQSALPIVGIYFLGHSLEHIRVPVIRVLRRYEDAEGNVLSGEREEFIESLTHDSFIVQIPHLKERRQTAVECLLGVFDQSQKDPKDAHTLSIREGDYPERFQPVIRRLIKAISEPQVREIMDVEDDVLEELEAMERKVVLLDTELEDKRLLITQKEAIIREQTSLLSTNEAAISARNAQLEATNAALSETSIALREKDAALSETSAVLREKDAALSETSAALREKDAALRQKNAIIDKAVQMLVGTGLSEMEARSALRL